MAVMQITTRRLLVSELKVIIARGLLAALPLPTSVSTYAYGQNELLQPLGKSSWIAAAGSNQVAVVAASSLRLERVIPAEGTPLGVLQRGERELVVTRFQGRDTIAIDAASGQVAQSIETGPGSSLLIPIRGSDSVMVSSEGDNRLVLFDPANLEVMATYSTGRRPFPGATTSHGRLALVPNYDSESDSFIVDL